VPREGAETSAIDAWSDIDRLGLYVHVPFCETRCSFCEYTVTKRAEHAFAKDYLDALLGELHLYREAVGMAGRELCGLDIGGGTPSFLPPEHIDRVLAEVRSVFVFSGDSDISIETTPKIAASDASKIAAYRRAGIDRISMGIQVVQPDLLSLLNRDTNGVEHHRKAVENIRAAGFERLNVDLMYGFRGQSLESWRATLEHAVALEPEYITLYQMRYKLTRISHHASDVTLDDLRPMARLAKSLLLDAGYDASPGKTTYSRVKGDVGTSSYLARRVKDGMPYLGLGLGAQSFTHTTIAYNDGAAGKNLAPYSKSVSEGRLPIQDLYVLPTVQVMAKMCSVSFYFGGIHLPSFRNKFGITLEEAFPDVVDFLLREGFMEFRGDDFRLTAKGVDVKSGVHALFYAPSIQAHLLDRDPGAARDLEHNRKRAERTAESKLVHAYV
jgi:oxygen-independent coproporphyrinogen-3 oxidase